MFIISLFVIFLLNLFIYASEEWFNRDKYIIHQHYKTTRLSDSSDDKNCCHQVTQLSMVHLLSSRQLFLKLNMAITFLYLWDKPWAEYT